MTVVTARNDPRPILPGDRVKVFNPRLYKDDLLTPSAITVKSAVVLRRYGILKSDRARCGPYYDVVDVKFDYDGRESKSHFTYGVHVIEYRNGQHYPQDNIQF